MNKLLNKLKTVDLSTFLFSVAFVIAVFPFVLCTTPLTDKLPLETYSKLCLVLSTGILALKCLLEVFFVKNVKKIIAALVALVVTVLVVISSKAIIFPLMIFQFVLCAGNIDKDKLIKLSFGTLLSAAGLVLLLYFTGIIEHEISNRAFSTVERWHFGFNYTTHLPNIFFALALMFVYIKREAIKFRHVFAIVLINAALYFFTDTKAIYAETLALCLGLVILKLTSFKGENAVSKKCKAVWNAIWHSRASRVVFVILCLVIATSVLYMAFWFDLANPEHIKLDDILSGRLYYAYEGVKVYGITPFGTEITWASGSNWQETADRYFFVDSSFVNIMLNYGVATLILLLSGLLKLCYDASKNGEKYFMLVLLVLFVHCAFDPQLFDLRYTPFLMLIGAYISPFEKRVTLSDIRQRFLKK